jgi:hypothetical protein
MVFFSSISVVAGLDGKSIPYNSVERSKDQKKTIVFSGIKSTFVISYSVCHLSSYSILNSSMQ